LIQSATFTAKVSGLKCGLDKTALPFVTVIMPIRNEAAFIERSLGAVLAQDYPHARLEVLIVDGMSTDQTRKTIRCTAMRCSDVRVVILDNPKQIVATGFNIALAKAQGEVIIRVDGHTIIAPDYVRQCVTVLARSGADNVGGRMRAVSDNGFGKAVALATSVRMGVGGARFHYSTQEEWVDTVYMGAWPHHIFDCLGPFDEAFACNEDDEFNYRLRAAGGKILLSPAIQSTYYNRNTPRALWRQYWRYGCWKVGVMQRHPRQMRPRQFMPPTFVVCLLSGLLLAPFMELVWWLWSGLLALYVSANLGASIGIASQHGWQHLRYLPTVLAILHLSYGLGFLIGLVSSPTCWNRHVSRVDHP
jgi:GT2 family glycosyltransferase